MNADATTVAPARSIVVGLSKIGLALRHHAWEQRGRTGLTPTQAQIVSILGSQGAQRVGELASLLAVSQPTVSDAVAALEAKLVVERAPAEDRRGRLIELTPAGRAVAASSSEWPDALLEAVDALDETEQATFVRGLSNMIRALQERGRIPVQRMCVSCRFFQPNAHPGSERPHHCAFVDAAFGDRELRLDCGDHQPTAGKEAA
jgi:DNA-binding MarR family transcriptional regulator